MAKTGLGNMTPFARWNYLRSKLSKEVKRQGYELQTGQFNDIQRKVWLDTKDRSVAYTNRILRSELDDYVSPTIDLATDNNPFPYWEFDSAFQPSIIPRNIYFDASTITGEIFTSQEYDKKGGYSGSIWQALVNAINKKGYSSTDAPHILITQPKWDKQERRFFSEMIITDPTGEPYDQQIFDPDTLRLIDENLPEKIEQPEEEEEEEKPAEEPKPERPTPEQIQKSTGKLKDQLIKERETFRLRDEIREEEKRQEKILRNIERFADKDEIMLETFRDQYIKSVNRVDKLKEQIDDL